MVRPSQNNESFRCKMWKMLFFCELVFSLQYYIIEFNPPNKCTWSCNVLARSRFKLSSAFISLKKCRIIKRYFLQYAAILVTTFSFIHIWGKSLINKQINGGSDCFCFYYLLKIQIQLLRCCLHVVSYVGFRVILQLGSGSDSFENSDPDP